MAISATPVVSPGTSAISPGLCRKNTLGTHSGSHCQCGCRVSLAPGRLWRFHRACDCAHVGHIVPLHVVLDIRDGFDRCRRVDEVGGANLHCAGDERKVISIMVLYNDGRFETFYPQT